MRIEKRKTPLKEKNYLKSILVLKSAFTFLIFFFVFASGSLSFSQETTKENDQAKLKEILEKTADYCERLKKMALHFVCHENIDEKIFTYKRVETVSADQFRSATPSSRVSLRLKKKKENLYVYDYQMIKKGGKKEEKRTLLKENKKEKHEENAELKIQRFKAKYLVYGPIGFLSSSWQNHFNYEIVGTEDIEGRKTIIISASPKKQREENYYSGKIWVAENDFSILKIEWDPKYIKGYEEEVSSAAGTLERTLNWVVYYEVEKNGVRFPSRQLIEEIYKTIEGNQHPKYTVSVVYDNYKFFIVEYEVKY